jgi:hypothetical protein
MMQLSSASCYFLSFVPAYSSAPCYQTLLICELHLLGGATKFALTSVVIYCICSHARASLGKRKLTFHETAELPRDNQV